MVGHWAERYVGMAFIEDVFDCADLVALVRLDRFGHTVSFPGREPGLRGKDAQIAVVSAAYCRPTDAPREGDLVLMRAAGRRASLGHHVGVWCDVAGEPHVLHCQAGVGTCLHPIRGLPARGLEVRETLAWN